MEEEIVGKKINWTKKPTWQDWVMFATIVFAILLWFFYKQDVANLHNWYQTNCICPSLQPDTVVENLSKLVN